MGQLAALTAARAAMIVAATALLACGCTAAWRVEHAKERANEQAAREHATKEVIDCLVTFVVVTDAPRLTGFELAEAGVAACASKTAALRAVLDDQGMDAREIRPYVDQTLATGKQQALAALAGSDRVRIPVKREKAAPDEHL